MLVCFRCNEVFTYEEGHRCLPDADDEDINDTENVLLIDYESVNFIHELAKSDREACIQTSGGDFNRLSAGISASVNNECLIRLPSIKQSGNQGNDGKFNHLEQNRSLSGNNSKSPSETSLSTYKTTFNKCQQNDKVSRSLDLKASLSSGKSADEFYRLVHLSVNEAPQQEDHTSKRQTLFKGKEKACPLPRNPWTPTSKGSCVCQQCGQNFRLESLCNAYVQNNCDPKPYKCDLYPKKYQCESLLTIHRRAHTREFPLKCDQCPFNFNWTKQPKNP